jgi:hypothetical protein
VKGLDPIASTRWANIVVPRSADFLRCADTWSALSSMPVLIGGETTPMGVPYAPRRHEARRSARTRPTGGLPASGSPTAASLVGNTAAVVTSSCDGRSNVLNGGSLLKATAHRIKIGLGREKRSSDLNRLHPPPRCPPRWPVRPSALLPFACGGGKPGHRGRRSQGRRCT